MRKGSFAIQVVVGDLSLADILLKMEIFTATTLAIGCIK
jgi:hypothetical protein